MSTTPESNQPENPSRRRFLQATGLAIIGTIATRLGLDTPTALAAPASPVAQPESPVPPGAGEVLKPSAAYIIPTIYEAPQEAVVQAEALKATNIRSGASTNDEILTTVQPGDSFTVLEDNVAPYGGNAHFDRIDTPRVDAPEEYMVDTADGEPTYEIISKEKPSIELPNSEPIAVDSLTSFYVKVSTGTGGLARSEDQAEGFMVATGAPDIDFSNPYRTLQMIEYDAVEAEKSQLIDGVERGFVTVAVFPQNENNVPLKAFVRKIDGGYEVISSRIGGLFTYRKIDVDDQGKIAFGDSSIISGKAV